VLPTYFVTDHLQAVHLLKPLCAGTTKEETSEIPLIYLPQQATKPKTYKVTDNILNNHSEICTVLTIRPEQYMVMEVARVVIGMRRVKDK
jgi:hypothetical protein